jgi:putative oxidoreductase
VKSDHDPEPRSSFLARYGTLVARLLFAPLLLGYAAMKVRALMGSVQADALQSFPMAQVARGMMLVLGYRTRLAAAAVIVLFVGVTALMLPMVGAPGGMGMAYVDQIIKNLAFIGGLMLLAVHGAGPVSLDARRAVVDSRR